MIGKDIRNRIIKFRGKQICDGEWVYGYYAVHHISLTGIDKKTNQEIRIGTEVVHSIFNDKKKTEGGYWKDIYPETVGQFTGYTDKNGKEIYEGDILKHGRDGRLYVVKFFYGMFYASVEECNKNIYGGFPLYVLTDEEDEYKCEIVGNVHDNKKI